MDSLGYSKIVKELVEASVQQSRLEPDKNINEIITEITLGSEYTINTKYRLGIISNCDNVDSYNYVLSDLNECNRLSISYLLDELAVNILLRDVINEYAKYKYQM